MKRQTKVVGIAFLGCLGVVSGATWLHGDFASMAPALEQPAVIAHSYSQWPVTAVAQKVGPSVVGIVNFAPKGNQALVPRGSGSGVIVRSDGYIVTNYHVIRGAKALQVFFSSGTKMSAKVIGTDPATDLAVLYVKTTNLPPVRFANSNQLQVGQRAIAIGDPLGLGFARTVTFGVVSGLNRTLGPGYAQRAFQLIQTDAAINPGNSGGALLNAQGELIGINSVKVAMPGFEGMGFAIPANTVAKVVLDLIQKGHVTRAWLGIAVLGQNTAARLGRSLGKGLYVEKVYPSGPAARLGLKRGDLIVALNQKPVTHLVDLLKVLNTAPVGTHVQLTYKRGLQKKTVKITLAPMPKQLTK